MLLIERFSFKTSKLHIFAIIIALLFLTACEKKDPKAYIEKGYLYYSNGNCEKALKEFKEAIDLDPNGADFQLFDVCAQVCLREKKYAEAIEFYDKSLEKNRNNYNTYYNLAWTIKAAGAHDKYLLKYKANLDKDPRDINTLMSRGILFALFDEKKMALADIDKAIKEKPLEIVLYELRSLINHLGGNEIQSEKDKSKAKMLKLEKELAEIKKEYSANPEDTKVFVKKGKVFMQNSDYANAEKEFCKALERENKNIAAYGELSTLYMIKKEYVKSIECYNKILEIAPETPEVYGNRGYTYLKMKEYSRAVNDLSKQLEKKPSYASGYVFRSEAYEKLGETVKAERDIEKAALLKPQYATIFALQASEYLKKGEYLKSIEKYCKAIKYNPTDAGLYENRAKVYEKMGNKSKAAADIKKAESLRK